MAELESSLTAMDWLPRLNVGGAMNGSEGFKSDGDNSDSNYKNGGKPPYSYANMISFAISSSTLRKMTLAEIYSWICENFTYYRTAGSGWKNSIRHNLSLNKMFLKLPRCKEDPGKGSYWALESNPPDDIPLSYREEAVAQKIKKKKPTDLRHNPYHPASETSDAVASISSTGPNVIVQPMLPQVPLSQLTVQVGDRPPTSTAVSPHINSAMMSPVSLKQTESPYSLTEDSLASSGTSDTNPTLTKLNEQRVTISTILNNPAFDELNESFKCLFRRMSEQNSKGIGFSATRSARDSLGSFPTHADLYEVLHHLDLCRESVNLGNSSDHASMFNFKDIIFESMRSADINNAWSLDTDHITDLALSLSQFLNNNPLKHPSTKPNTLPVARMAAPDLGPSKLVMQESPVIRQDTKQSREATDEIEDEFDWNSLI